MQTAIIFAAILLLTMISFTVGRRRAVQAVGGNVATLHSRPGHYGWYVALWCALPAFAVMVLWMLIQPLIVTSTMRGGLPESVRTMEANQQSLVLNRIRGISHELAPLSVGQLRALTAACHRSTMWRPVVSPLAWRRSRPFDSRRRPTARR